MYIVELFVNSGDLDQTPHAASDLGRPFASFPFRGLQS